MLKRLSITLKVNDKERQSHLSTSKPTWSGSLLLLCLHFFQVLWIEEGKEDRINGCQWLKSRGQSFREEGTGSQNLHRIHLKLSANSWGLDLKRPHREEPLRGEVLCRDFRSQPLLGRGQGTGPAKVHRAWWESQAFSTTILTELYYLVGYTGVLCLTSYNCMWISGDPKIKNLIKKNESKKQKNALK